MSKRRINEEGLHKDVGHLKIRVEVPNVKCFGGYKFTDIMAIVLHVSSLCVNDQIFHHEDGKLVIDDHSGSLRKSHIQVT